MEDRSRVSIRRIPLTRCARCGSALPAAAATGRPRVYCSPACRKAAYEDRRARKAAVQTPGKALTRSVMGLQTGGLN